MSDVNHTIRYLTYVDDERVETTTLAHSSVIASPRFINFIAITVSVQSGREDHFIARSCPTASMLCTVHGHMYKGQRSQRMSHQLQMMGDKIAQGEDNVR